METKTHHPLIAASLCALLTSCAAPTVNLSTAEPIKVDIDMRLDVYQHAAAAPKTDKPAAPAAENPEARRRNRMADIQTFKNNQLVGEGRDGLLVSQEKIKEQPDEYREYIRVTVEAENKDRMDLMKSLAEKEKISLPVIQSRQAEIWRNRSWKGELIEVPQPDGSFKWQPKEG